MKNKFLKGIAVLTIADLSILSSSIGVNAEYKLAGNNTTIDGYYLNSSGKLISNPSIDNKKEKELFFINRGYEKDNKKYIEGYFDKFVTDLDEARDYEKRTGYHIICHDETGDYIQDDGFDMPVSSITTLEVDNNVNISEIDFDSKGCILNINKDFNSIIIGKYKDEPIFEITLKEGKVTELHQEYRP